MISRRVLLCSTLCVICWPAEAQVDPATVYAGATIIQSAFSKSPPNLTLEMARANRELLVATHARLEVIEDGIDLLLKRFEDLDLKLRDANLHTLQTDYLVQLSSSISSAKQELITYQSLEEPSAAQIENIAERFRNTLADVTDRNLRFLEQPASFARNAVFLVYGGYAELALRSFVATEFETPEIRDLELQRARTSASSFLRAMEVLTRREETSSTLTLPKWLDELSVEFKLNANFPDLTDPTTRWPIEGAFLLACETEQYVPSIAYTVQEKDPGPCGGGPGEGGGCTSLTVTKHKNGPLTDTGKYTRVLLTTEQMSPGGPFTMPSYRLSVETSESAAGCKDEEVDQVLYKQSDGARNYEDHYGGILEVQMARLQLFLSVAETTALVNDAKSRFRSFVEGNVEEFDFQEIAFDSVNGLAVLADHELSLSETQMQFDSQSWRAAKNTARNQVAQLMAEQERSLKEAFENAAAAASTNRALAQIVNAASLYRYGSEMYETLKREGVIAEDTETEIASGVFREPGSYSRSVTAGVSPEAVLHENFLAFQELVVATRIQKEITDFRMKEKFSLEPGRTQEYDLYMTNQQTFIFQKSDMPSLHSATTQWVSKFRVTGYEPLPWEK